MLLGKWQPKDSSVGEEMVVAEVRNKLGQQKIIMREENSREKKKVKVSKFADQKACWGIGSKHTCVAFFFYV